MKMCIALVPVLAVFSCSLFCQQPPAAKSYVGKAGDMFISEDEFTRRFELLPSLYRHRKSKLEEDKLALLYSIIAEKLLAREAVMRKFDEDSAFRSAFDEIRKMLARDDLYREEVKQKVSVSNAEVRQGVKRALQQPFLEYLYFPREEDAKFVRERLRTPREFENLQTDSSMQAQRDTATAIWGEADTSITNAAYRLKTGEISPVVHAGQGYYILKLVKLEQSSYYSSMQPDVLQERVSEKLRLQKEKARLDEFLQDFLKERRGYSVSRSFQMLTNTLTEVFGKHTNESPIMLGGAVLHDVLEMCRSILNDTLTVVGNSYWSVGSLIDKLAAKGFSIHADEITTIPRRLNAQLKVWVQQELLAQEALRRGLDRRAGVQQELEIWHQAYLADVMKAYVRKSVTVSKGELYSYLKQKNPSTKVPQVQIRELRTGSLDEMEEALRDLENKTPFEAVIEKWSIDVEAKKRKGVSEFFSITDRPPVGEIASQMDVGQRYGPIRVADGVLLFELAARKDSSLASDTSTVAGMKKAAEELLKMKQKRTLDTFVSQIGERYGFAIYQDRLSKIAVSPISMMTFRILGFGGRMFAIPFVEKQLDWLNIEPPKSPILP